MSETIHRHFVMLRLVPRAPANVDTSTLVTKLAARGFFVTQRSVQRDLDKLSTVFPLVCDDSTKPYLWSWLEDAELFDMPTMDPQTALTLGLAADYLLPMLPRSSLRYLERHFDRARAVLRGLSQSPLAAWPNKIRVLGRGQPLRPPTVRADVIEAVYTALLERRRFRARYRRRKDARIADYEVNPLALVLRAPVVYLLCTFWEYDEVHQFALQRITRAELLDAPSRHPPGFDLDSYIEQGGFGFRLGAGPLRLVAMFDPQAAFPLSEMPVSKDQWITELRDGRLRLAATVPDTVEIRTWLRGFGHLVEVVKPAALRREFADLAQQLAARYALPRRARRLSAGSATRPKSRVGAKD